MTSIVMVCRGRHSECCLEDDAFLFAIFAFGINIAAGREENLKRRNGRPASPDEERSLSLASWTVGFSFFRAVRGYFELGRPVVMVAG